MKWAPEKCKRGDVIRSKQGSIYHYGIYVSDEEVIQFGPSPLLHPSGVTDDDMRVLATDISDFACGKTVEKALLSFSERLKAFSSEKRVRLARARIGEGGYNPLHNNCEHFAYECLTGVKYSAQEEELRNRWRSRPMLDVYISAIPATVTVGDVFPKARAKEIQNCTNEKVRVQKYWAWRILELAVKTSIRKPMTSIRFAKTANGKWIADGFEFSITHTDGMVAVAVSNAPVGIDAERVTAFHEKWSDKNMSDALTAKILTSDERAPETTEELLLLWTKKESAYKRLGKGKFSPKKIRTESCTYAVKNVDDCLITVCSDRLNAMNVYLTDGNDIEKVKE